MVHIGCALQCSAVFVDCLHGVFSWVSTICLFIRLDHAHEVPSSSFGDIPCSWFAFESRELAHGAVLLSHLESCVNAAVCALLLCAPVQSPPKFAR